MDDNMKYLVDELLNEPHGRCCECGRMCPKDELIENEALWDGLICDACASDHSDDEYTAIWGDTDPQEEK